MKYQLLKIILKKLVIKNINKIVLQNDLLKVYKFLFGTGSNLYRTFEHYLDISKKDYLIFMITFFLSCKNKQTVSAIWSMFDIDHDYYMDVKTYNHI